MLLEDDEEGKAKQSHQRLLKVLGIEVMSFEDERDWRRTLQPGDEAEVLYRDATPRPKALSLFQ